ncbi:MAG: DUF4097 family beta strand repeat protein [Lachnospiraceae bacterium]|nr:DUF4097 family beta strand repeat protein [Lachnospiraceae bacterium]
MKKTIQVLLIIAAVCAGAGILLIGFGVIAGGSVHNYFEKVNEESSWLSLPDRKKDSVSIDYSPDEKIESLDISMNIGALKIQPSQDAWIHVEMEGNLSVSEAYLSGDVLHIVNKGKRQKQQVDITLSIPEGRQFDDLRIVVHAGEVTCKLDSLAAENADITVDAGTLEMKALTVTGDTNLDVGTGEAKLDMLTTGELSVNTGVGETDLTVEAEGDIEVSCGVGSVNLVVKAAETNYDYVLDCGIGSLVIGTNSYDGLGHSTTIDNHASKTITADCGVGELKIRFTE